MSKERELLRRALEALDIWSEYKATNLNEDKTEILSTNLKIEIRAFLAAESEAEPTKIKIEAERQDIDWQSNEGAVYLFAGWLTTRDKVISCGRTENASPMAEAIKEYKAEYPERFGNPTEPESDEPVAWYHPSGDGYDSNFRDHEVVKACTGNPWTGWIPLYIRPESARKPMSLDECLKRWEVAKMMYGFTDNSTFIAGVRFAEKHHGILGGSNE